jgi:hypothetical protein
MLSAHRTQRPRLAKQKIPVLGFALGCLAVILILFALFAVYVITRPRGYFDEQDIHSLTTPHCLIRHHDLHT